MEVRITDLLQEIMNVFEESGQKYSTIKYVLTQYHAIMRRKARKDGFHTIRVVLSESGMETTNIFLIGSTMVLMLKRMGILFQEA